MSAAVAMEVFADSTRSKLRAYIGQAQKEKDRKDSAMLIKKMVQFNSLVVTPIMDKIQVGGAGGAEGCTGLQAVCSGGDDAKRNLVGRWWVVHPRLLWHSCPSALAMGGCFSKVARCW